MSPTSYRAAPPRGAKCTGGGGVSQWLGRETNERAATPSPCPLPLRGRGRFGTGALRARRRHQLEDAGAGDAVGLAGVVVAGAPQRPQHAPGGARREEPVGLAAEGAPELLHEAATADVDGARQVEA